jgi:hypothetical protein
MSTYITLARAKRQLRVDYSDDDRHIQELLDRIEGMVESMFLEHNHTQAQFNAVIANARKLVKIELAILDILTDFYVHRSGRVTKEKTQEIGYDLGEVNRRVEKLIGPMIKRNI